MLTEPGGEPAPVKVSVFSFLSLASTNQLVGIRFMEPA